MLCSEHELKHRLAVTTVLFSENRQFKILVRVRAKLMKEAWRMCEISALGVLWPCPLFSQICF